MKNILETFLWTINDERIRRLIKKVWSRIPAYDRAVLLALICGFSDFEDGEYILGSAGPANAASIENGCAGDAAMNLDYYVNLGGVRKTKSDKAAMAVIAHELAHIVLRHNQLGVVIDTLRDFDIYSHSYIKNINQNAEETADLLIWTWGFHDELRTLFDEFPKTFKPRWFIEIHTEEEKTVLPRIKTQ